MAYKLMNLGGFGKLFTFGNGSMVVSLDEEGKIDGCLEGDNGAVMFISETHQIKDKLFFASPFNRYLGMLDMNIGNKPEKVEEKKSKPKEQKAKESKLKEQKAKESKLKEEKPKESKLKEEKTKDSKPKSKEEKAEAKPE